MPPVAREPVKLAALAKRLAAADNPVLVLRAGLDTAPVPGA
jgi:hypothetical protein